MIALPLLATAAGAIGNTCCIAPKPDYSEPAVIWAAIIAESGTRKSSALDAPVKPIRRRDAIEVRKHNEAMAEYATLMQRHKADEKQWRGRDKDGKPPKEPPRPIERRYTLSDVTMEGLVQKLQDNPRGLLNIREELAGFFLGQNQYRAGGKGSDETHYLAMHGARAVLMDRKSAERPRLYVPRAALSIVGTIQPGTLRRVWTRERLESGISARFLVAYPPRRRVRWREQWVQESVEGQYTAMMDALLSLSLFVDPITNEPEPARLSLTPEAKRLWVDFHDAHAEEQLEHQGELSAAWAKLTGYAARLALVCELCGWASGSGEPPPARISKRAMSAGIALARWFSAEAKRVYAVLHEGDEQKADRELADYVRARGGSITPRDLARGPRRYRDNAEADLQRLVATGWGHWTTERAAKGPASRRFVLSGDGDEISEIAGESTLPVTVATEVEDENEEFEWFASLS